MTCPSALTRSRYADGALPREEAVAVERHLASCAACRVSVEGLAAESSALRAAMHAADVTGAVPAFAPRPTIARLLSWLGWTALAVWAANAGWTTLTAAAEAPRWLGWLAPDAAGMALDLAVGLFVLLALDGGQLFVGAMQSAAWVALVAVASAGIWLLAHRKIDQATSVCVSLGAITVLMTVLAPPVHAFELRRDEDRVTIPAGETIDDTLVVMAEVVLVEGTVTGDLIALGEQVSVRGRVGGTLVAVAEVLSVEGEVAGSVLGIGETVDFRGAALGANVVGIGRAVTVHADTSVAGNAALAAEEAEMHGGVGRDLLALTQHFSLFGNVDGDFRAYGEQVDVAPSARVGGDLTAKVASTDHLRLAGGATVEGATDISTWPEEPSKYLTFEYYLGQSLRFLAAFVTGLVLFRVFPTLRRMRLDGGAEVLTAMGIGAVALVATPALALGATLTLIGAPLGILAFLLWLAALYTAGIVTAGHVGRLLLDGDVNGRALPLLLGLTILFVLINVPLLGGLVRLVAIVVGLGLIVQWLRGLWADRPA